MGLDLAEIVMEVENLFDMEFNGDGPRLDGTVGGLVRFVREEMDARVGVPRRCYGGHAFRRLREALTEAGGPAFRRARPVTLWSDLGTPPEVDELFRKTQRILKRRRHGAAVAAFRGNLPPSILTLRDMARSIATQYGPRKFGGALPLPTEVRPLILQMLADRVGVHSDAIRGDSDMLRDLLFI